MQNGYVVKGRENDPSAHTFKRNGQGTGYKPRKGSNGGSSSRYNGGETRPHRDDSAGSSSQPKIVFNEEEYTRVTTPRQDILFKKSYLLQKKPWAENASTSATPSTTESQSASHSTAGRGIGRSVKHFNEFLSLRFFSVSHFFSFLSTSGSGPLSVKGMKKGIGDYVEKGISSEEYLFPAHIIVAAI